MKYIEFDESRPMDLVLLGRVAIDFNPAYNDQVKEEFKPLKKVHMFEKFVGGSPANIAVGVTKHGLKAGFIGKVSDDQFGEYVVDISMREESIPHRSQSAQTERNWDLPLPRCFLRRKAASSCIVTASQTCSFM